MQALNDIEFRLLRAQEAPELVAFVEKLYGETYPNDLLYDARRMEHLIRAGRLCCSVAIDAGGGIVGHLATYYEYDGDVTADGISGMVVPEFRGSGMMSRISGPMFPRYESEQLAGLHLYAVTLHDISQRRSASAGAVVTGVLLQDWPGDYTVEGFRETLGLARMPIVTLFMPIFPDSIPPRTVYSPPRWRDTLESMYHQMGATRSLAGEGAPVTEGVSRVEELLKPAQGAGILRFHEIAGDWETRVTGFTSVCEALPALYVDIPLTDPAAPLLIESLSQKNWYYGALLPERCGTDFCRLQRGLPADDWRVARTIEEAGPALELIYK